VDTSFRGIGFRPAPGTDTDADKGRFPVTTSFSTIVFHSPQAGHLPIHLEYSLPQFEQNQTVFAFVAISRFLYLREDTKKRYCSNLGQYPIHRRI
jgi:hypothetical protein